VTGRLAPGAVLARAPLRASGDRAAIGAAPGTGKLAEATRWRSRAVDAGDQARPLSGFAGVGAGQAAVAPGQLVGEILACSGRRASRGFACSLTAGATR
jgi:hypothetical protein